VRAVAAWLIARPQNAIAGLAATLLLPLAPLVSGAVMALLVLGQGVAPAAFQGAAAMAILSASSLIVGAPVAQMSGLGVVAWAPAMLLALLVRSTRSLTLTLQVWAIAAMVATVGFFVVVDDPVAFWVDALAAGADWLRKQGFANYADFVYEARQEYAPRMTLVAVISIWSLYAIVLLLGYAVYGALPGKSGEFGRFRHLDFGRVLATMMAVASLLSLLSGAGWLRSLAFVSFAVFWLQGLALLHWLRGAGRLPLPALVVAYASLPVLMDSWFLGLALAGYVDAWFRLRFREGPR
jgi:hypothetical protein